MRPPMRSPTPIFRLLPLPKYAVKAPVMTRKRLNVRSRMVTKFIIGFQTSKLAIESHLRT